METLTIEILSESGKQKIQSLEERQDIRIVSNRKSKVDWKSFIGKTNLGSIEEIEEKLYNLRNSWT